MDLPVWFVVATILFTTVHADQKEKVTQKSEENNSEQQKQHKREDLQPPPPPPPTPPTLFHQTPQPQLLHQVQPHHQQHQQQQQHQQIQQQHQYQQIHQQKQPEIDQQLHKHMLEQLNHQYQQHEQQRPRYMMKEVILYLKPSQIKALESGQSYLKVHPPTYNQQDSSNSSHKIELVNQKQNTLHDEAQMIQQEIDQMESDRKSLQLQEAIVQPAPSNVHEHQQVPHNIVQQIQLLKPEALNNEHIQLLKPELFNNEQQIQLLRQNKHLDLIQQPLIPQIQTHIPNLEKHLHHDVLVAQNNQYIDPQNYAHFYLLPQANLEEHEKLKLFQQATQQQLLIQPKHYPLKHLNPHFQLIPYNYGKENELEAHKILLANLENPHLEGHSLKAHEIDEQELEGHHLQVKQLEAVQNLQLQKLFGPSAESHILDTDHLQPGLKNHQLEAHGHDLGTQHHLETQEQLEAQYNAIESAQKLKEHELKGSFDTHLLETHEPHLEAQHHLETQEQLKAQHDALQGAQQLEIHQKKLSLKNQQAKAHALHHFETQEDLKAQYDSIAGAQKLETYHIKPSENLKLEAVSQFESLKQLKLESLETDQMKEIIEAQKLKAKLQAQEAEAERLDAQLKAEELKVEDLKEEQQRLQIIRNLKSNKKEFQSILNPLVQHQNIMELALIEPKDFATPELEKGFKPLEYSPQDNKEKYSKEVEKILLENEVVKQNAFKKAAATATEKPMIIKEEVIKPVNIPIPTPYIIRVPEPFEVKKPQPYPVPLEIIRHIPFPMMKVEKVELEKPVSMEVEKRAPVPVPKPFFVKVTKPYVGKRLAPLKVKKERPIVRSRSPKVSIIKHVTWNN